MRLVPLPICTGRATFGSVGATFHAIADALAYLGFDASRWLSPNCLPIKPVADFDVHVGSGGAARLRGWTPWP